MRLLLALMLSWGVPAPKMRPPEVPVIRGDQYVFYLSHTSACVTILRQDYLPLDRQYEMYEIQRLDSCDEDNTKVYPWHFSGR